MPAVWWKEKTSPPQPGQRDGRIEPSHFMLVFYRSWMAAVFCKCSRSKSSCRRFAAENSFWWRRYVWPTVNGCVGETRTFAIFSKLFHFRKMLWYFSGRKCRKTLTAAWLSPPLTPSTRPPQKWTFDLHKTLWDCREGEPLALHRSVIGW